MKEEASSEEEEWDGEELFPPEESVSRTSEAADPVSCEEPAFFKFNEISVAVPLAETSTAMISSRFSPRKNCFRAGLWKGSCWDCVFQGLSVDV